MASLTLAALRALYDTSDTVTIIAWGQRLGEYALGFFLETLANSSKDLILTPPEDVSQQPPCGSSHVWRRSPGIAPGSS